ncbi:MAG: beta-N-acetylhexosaminidase [Hyphomonadaceae bacterium]|nr:beta-N-acetylhexosaminidase [Hyphomonadaceae bacterium]
MSALSCAFGVRTPAIDADWRAFLSETQPWGLILFREACVSREQVKRLCADARDALGRDAIIWIDQEGGRVARLKPPEWPVWPAPARYGAIYAEDKARGLEACTLGYRLIADELKRIGVDADFAPVLDTPVSGADPIIGDRAFAMQADVIVALGRAALAGLHAGGVAGCIKHMPGHGRAEADSHLALPRVAAGEADLVRDVAPFAALKDAEAAMTAHIVFDAWDCERPATCSEQVIREIIRGAIGFRGLLMSDDLDMKALALTGDLAHRARAALGAGCDIVLQCNGVLADMRLTAEGCRPLEGASLSRAETVEAFAKAAPEPFEPEAGWRRFRDLIGAR